MQSRPLLFSKQAEVLSEENDLLNPNEIWKLAYTNFEDFMHEVITLL